MSLFAELRMYGRFASGLGGFLRRPISLAEARATIQQRLEQREENFLRLIDKGIYGYPRSPYLPLLRLAQVTAGDIRAMVRARGLEGTLHALREAGVYVTFEEFKAGGPMVRQGQVFQVRPGDFDNPYLPHAYHSATGGSTGAGTRVATDLDHLRGVAPLILLAREAHGLLNLPTAMWFGSLPDGTGINKALRQIRIGQPVQAWFTVMVSGHNGPGLKNRLTANAIVALSRLNGAQFPWPQPVPLEEAQVIAEWAGRQLQEHGRCLILTHVSKALRICLAAKQAGIDLTGATLMGGGEPPTRAKVRGISDTGAAWVPNYFFTEAGALGWGCAHPLDGNDLHFFRDTAALIQYPQRAGSSQITVPGFVLTGLLPTSPKILLNVETDDFGEIEERACGCALEALGYTQHLRHIYSIHKLTGEGVTLVGNQLLRVIEEVLPARFGGSALDYQLVEEEDGQGFTRLNLLLSPRLRVPDDQTVVAEILQALGKTTVAAAVAEAMWRQAGTLHIKREEPRWTERGKLMTLRPAGRQNQTD